MDASTRMPIDLPLHRVYLPRARQRMGMAAPVEAILALVGCAFARNPLRIG